MTRSEETGSASGRRRHARSATYFTTPVSSVEARMAAGKALRAKVSRERHGEYEPPVKREDPVAILEEQAKTRLPSLIPIRYARMLANPFAFLRGAAAVMAADLSPTPVTGLKVQACGDMHVANFGVFASAERNLVFGINDFDETLPGPWEWDLKRMAASAVVACRVLGGDRTLCEEAARAAVRSYRKRMREFAFIGHRDVWYSRIGEQDILAGLSPGARARARSIMAKAKQSGSVQKPGKMTEIVNGRPRLVEQKPLIVRETHMPDGRPVLEMLASTLDRYLQSLPEERRTLLRRYRALDVARKVVGVGSVGTRCWLLLMRGNGPEDLLFLQYKEAQRSVLAPYSKTPAWECEGRRVVVGQRLIQGAPDIFLGWGINVEGIHFYMRQLSDMKGGYDFDPAKARVRNFPQYCKLCGWALALAHAKSGDPAVIAGYLGKSDRIDEAVARFAFAYARQNERDCEAFAKAAKANRIQAAETA